MMKQYMEIKSQYPGNILFFRLGDFYEMFFDDAKIVSEELDLTLTGKQCGLEERAPMCGIPYHSCEAYIARLVEKGYKVAICEQTEDPALAKGIVKRDVIRIITPGTVTDGEMLDESSNNYLAGIAFLENKAGICFTDASTGESHVTEISGENLGVRLIDELERFNPRELLITEGYKAIPALSSFISEDFKGVLTLRLAESFDPLKTEPLLLKHFDILSTEALNIPSGSAAAAALGSVIEYLYETGITGSIAVNSVDFYSESQFMRLDMTAVRNLEICETMRYGAKKGSLLWVLDKTKTAMGKRLIKAWLEKPLLSIAEITMRQNAVEELISDTVMRGEIIECLSGISDIQRLMAKITYRTANARDLLKLADTAAKFPKIKALLQNANCRMLAEIHKEIKELKEITDLIFRAISDKAPIALKEGGLINSGYNEEVDQLREIVNNGTNFLAEIEAREREVTGIKNLKVRYNKVFGYYIEVTNSFLDKVPEYYTRRQTLVNCERFITSELKQLEAKTLTASERINQLEFEIFEQIRDAAAAELKHFQLTAAAIAKFDVLCSFAEVSIANNYCRPLVNNSGAINIKSGRHPVVERVLKTPFVSNDTLLDMNENRCAIITGPNMAGKSTYMRQVALIVLMAQIGCFVPAQIAEIGVVDAIFTRVGASDDLASGKSTFMVEMSEVSDILKNATKNSLLILDEIGRGTSTYDGMSIARAVLEYAANKRTLGAKTLFSTHYHELTDMEDKLKGVKNYNIAVKKRGDDIIFLRRIVRGGADDSYGIEVAKLSGIPNAVITRAKEILKETLENGVVTYKTANPSSMQLPIEMQGAIDIMKELQTIDVNTLTPIEALSLLFEYVNKAKSLS